MNGWQVSARRAAVSDVDFPAAPRKREYSIDARHSRDATALVRPINERLGGWQADGVRLIASIERMRRSARHDPHVIEAALVLIGRIEEEERTLRATLAGLPEEVALHSRVADTQQALALLQGRLSRALHGDAPRR
jgi:hypothetical protein